MCTSSVWIIIITRWKEICGPKWAIWKATHRLHFSWMLKHGIKLKSSTGLYALSRIDLHFIFQANCIYRTQPVYGTELLRFCVWKFWKAYKIHRFTPKSRTCHWLWALWRECAYSFTVERLQHTSMRMRLFRHSSGVRVPVFIKCKSTRFT